MFYYWPRAMLKGPKRRFVVVVVLGVVETWVKNVPNGPKNVPYGTKIVRVQIFLQIEQKTLQKEQKMFANENSVQSDEFIALCFSCCFSWA